ncbi:hypothetical protein C9J03_12055 [Photobacterium gaetbulicola]|uniref:Uncharacterized protein n=1 Tax=Photobacterium gaetbulicola Gung47 TaxID=658445 RepID=A0A0C5X005_9GAMM|nr:major capsid protein [Photobacterium gaetbulicola]AJR08650.1 hypothetical protein H744_2c1986 [Photobacterium gaetbulicola Gung47]AJR08684.1 hypothetical protein H744_2c2020 [Photobacterium gaetbulicola Gung47]PSU10278.1 hypothetical protein C9J03_11855 [Photobacterium gaetbulicola]PSU10317.1 hypothetical protein C9J03_12055 [Photobacterium gaetbulicola]
MKKSNVILIATAVLASASPAFAETVDVSGAVTVIAGITAAVSAIGVAKLAPAATSVAFKWVKGAIFS